MFTQLLEVDHFGPLCFKTDSKKMAPFPSVWTKDVLPKLELRLEAGAFGIMSTLEELKVQFSEFECKSILIIYNTILPFCK